MSNHIFHPPTNLPDLVAGFVTGLADHKHEYGDVPENKPADLKQLVKQAAALAPAAKEIHDLELNLAAKREAYNKKARPVWDAFSEKLAFARVYANKSKATALQGFLKLFTHHTVNHAAAKKVVPAAT